MVASPNMRTISCRLATAALLMTLIAATGCGVRKDIHQAALATIGSQEADLNQARVQRQALIDELERAQSELAEARKKLSEISGQHDHLLTENGVLRDRLSEMGQDVDRLTEETGALAASLEEARVALAELRERQKALEQAERNLENIRNRLQELIDAGTLSVRLERGRIVINLKQDILFGSGSAELSKEGIAAIEEVGRALADFGERSFQVEGHTDNVPIQTARYPSNWELSAARAMAVVHVLVDGGMEPGHVSGAGFGEHWPVDSNDNGDGRAKNRRIEIVMLPDIEAVIGEQ